MVTIYINGNVVHARDDATVLEASREDFYATKMYDIRIPSLQYLKDVKKEDSSGLCSVLVEGMDGLVNASEIPVKEGMHVSTREPEVREAWAHADHRRL